MSREGRQEIDKLFRMATQAGYVVTRANARQMMVTHPTTGEWERITTNPSGRQIANERAKLRRIGAPITEQDLKVYLAVLAAQDAKDQAGQPPAAAAAAAPAPPPPAPPAPPPDPAPFRAPAAGSAPAPSPSFDIDAADATRDPFVAASPKSTRPASKDTASAMTTTYTSSDAGGGLDIASTAFVLWGSIRERPDCQRDAVIDGVPGLSWRGTMSSVFKELWPALGVDQRKRINLYLRETENMICLKKGPTPLWWLRGEWRDIASEPASVIEVRGRPRSSAPRLTAGPPAPVTVIRPGRSAAAMHPRVSPPAPAAEGPGPATAALEDSFATLRAVFDQRDELLAENGRLTKVNAQLAQDLDSTRKQLAALKSALAGLAG